MPLIMTERAQPREQGGRWSHCMGTAEMDRKQEGGLCYKTSAYTPVIHFLQQDVTPKGSPTFQIQIH